MKRAIFIIICITIGASTAILAPPVSDNSDLVVIITTVFAVFAGFLIAIIAVIGDPSLIPEGSWRVAENRRDTIDKRLVWHTYLFMMYLFTIALLFVGIMIREVTSSGSVIDWRNLIERAYLFFGVTSFLLSFALPWSLKGIQSARVEAEIRRRRKLAGLDLSSSEKEKHSKKIDTQE